MVVTESIYNLIPRPVEVPEKPPRHISKYPGKVQPASFEMGVQSRRGHATFGAPPGTVAPDTTKFLKSHSMEPVLPDPEKPNDTGTGKATVKPPVPRRTEVPVHGLVSAKNFVTANAVEVILADPGKKTPDPMLWTEKSDYGKTPTYLKKIKSKLAEEKQAVENWYLQQEQLAGQGMQPMDEEDRLELLGHLKEKWGKLNEAYQKLTFTLDTPAKQKRKERYEADLTQLETDIHKLSKPNVMVNLYE
ncbi:hypothetical protein PPROV_000817500 [Pycnococcus provasolii]|uniref:Enkurin domain-containing protein n=1 Tax=Pycnococcus provasolii TaxID=41880 RepID=A0A830HUK4_9CHLO|nr:hypothetical protein PPROV_000817500 [Pycnococcus provasolii]